MAARWHLPVGHREIDSRGFRLTPSRGSQHRGAGGPGRGDRPEFPMFVYTPAIAQNAGLVVGDYREIMSIPTSRKVSRGASALALVAGIA